MGLRNMLVGGLLATNLCLVAYILYASSSSDEDPCEVASVPRPSGVLANKRGELSRLNDRCFALRRRVQELQAKVESSRPIHERFERASRTPADEDRMRTLLAHVFDDPSQYDLECRERMCKIVIDRDRAPANWYETLQRHSAIQGHFSEMMMGTDMAIVNLADEAIAAQFQIWNQVAEAMGASAELRSCKDSNPTPAGEVVIRLALVGRRLEASVGGSLATQPAGACMERVMAELLRDFEVPAPVTTLDPEMTPFTIKVP